MPFCPSCRYEYVDGLAKCPDCEVELVAERPNDPPEQHYIDEEFVPIYLGTNWLEIDIVKGILLGAGIPVIDKSPIAESHLDGFFRGMELGEKTLTVPKSRAEEARKVLEEAEKSGEEMDPEEGSQV